MEHIKKSAEYYYFLTNKSHTDDLILHSVDSKVPGIIQSQASITSCLDHCNGCLIGHVIPQLKTLQWLSSANKTQIVYTTWSPV